VPSGRDSQRKSVRHVLSRRPQAIPGKIDNRISQRRKPCELGCFHYRNKAMERAQPWHIELRHQYACRQRLVLVISTIGSLINLARLVAELYH
jgi:hypothetical protein